MCWSEENNALGRVKGFFYARENLSSTELIPASCACALLDESF